VTALVRNDRIPDDAPQNKVKLEWITPKISLMEGGDTDGSKISSSKEQNNVTIGPNGTKGAVGS
jgi:hypothetical protein